jgi:hypothetical protein
MWSKFHLYWTGMNGSKYGQNPRLDMGTEAIEPLKNLQ